RVVVLVHDERQPVREDEALERDRRRRVRRVLRPAGRRSITRRGAGVRGGEGRHQRSVAKHSHRLASNRRWWEARRAPDPAAALLLEASGVQRDASASKRRMTLSSVSASVVTPTTSVAERNGVGSTWIARGRATVCRNSPLRANTSKIVRSPLPTGQRRTHTSPSSPTYTAMYAG